ncbi:MAG: tRNA (adenosine(37)-N6)-dimethylallyltransferase MiaA [Nitrospinae bacterium]|nr:tRNA (adenosine(37)-N6)-dimethylallyltransferase MiaA [Nitrospinota bacterium]
MPDIRLAVIAGPTATGKSETAVAVAKALDGEIINADSIQLYRHFDIGSAKPSREMRRAVPHHMVDALEPDAHFTLWDYKEAAREAIRDIASRGKLPILCGGTGLYIKAALEDLHGGAKQDEGLRHELLATPREDLYARLQTLDPRRAQQVHPNDTYRIIRGIENALLPVNDAPREKPPYDVAYFVLTAPRNIVHERIGRRVETMLNNGWIEEVRGILARGYPPECKPFKSVGYSQIVQCLNGELAEDALKERITIATRQYAKRQFTWFGAVAGAVAVRAESAEGTARIIKERMAK